VARIFISYRREDSDIWVGRLVDELRQHFPPEHIFQDISSIDPGADFRTVLNEALATAAATLVVIGPRWLSATDKQGRKRLENPADLVRQEVAESLRRAGVRVFPLLVNDAEMPAEEDLPEPLKALAHRQAFELTVRHWTNDVEQLVLTLRRAPGLADDRRAGEDIARQRAEEEAMRRKAVTGSQRRAADEQVKKSADEEARPKPEEARRRGEEENQCGAAEEIAPSGIAPPQAPWRRWKAFAGIGAIIGVAALAMFFLGENRPKPATPTPAAPAEKPTVSSTPPAVALPTEKPSAPFTPPAAAPSSPKSQAVAPAKVATGAKEFREATGGQAMTPAELTAELRGGNDQFVQLVQLANGRLASASRREVKIWNLTTLREESAITDATRPIAALDNKILASRGGKVVVWGPSSAPEAKSLDEVEGGSWFDLDDLAVGHGKVIGCSLVGGIAVWSLATGKLERRIKERLVVKLLLLRDGRLVIGRTNGMIEIWNVSSGEPQILVREGTSSNDWIMALVELHDGRLAYTTQGGTAVNIWSHISNKKESVAFTPGTRASGSETTLATTPGTRPYGLAVLADGQLAILEQGGEKNRVSIWNRDASQRNGLFEFDSKLTGQFSFGANLVPLQDGRFATGGYGRVQIWRLPRATGS